MSFRIKISFDDITYGPNSKDINTGLAKFVANLLMVKGYRKTSNAYCMVSRIDRDDWADVVSKTFGPNATIEVSDSWRDYYVRVHSKDTHTVHPKVIRFMKSYR